MRKPFVALLIGAALAMPAGADAVELQIANGSAYHDDEVWVAVYGTPGSYNVTDDELTPVPANETKRLSELHGGILEINEIVNGRVYISYGTPTVEPPDFASKTSRFAWVELNETGAEADKINLTAVDQFAIGMRLDSYGGGQHLEELGSANSNTIFDALQQIPGGEAATIRNSSGEILRVLSPTHTSYPNLGEYVRSMAGKEVTVRSAFSSAEGFTASHYSGSFEADGSITLKGSFHGPAVPAHEAPAEIHFPGAQLIEDIYTGANTPNDLEGSIRHDVLVGFMAGYWDGSYGNDAIGFCSNPEYHRSGYEAFPYCQTGVNQPAYGAARPALSPFPTCEQYAAVINQYAEMYGNPYSDGAAGNVAINVNQSESDHKAVDLLKLTTLPDSGNAQPVHSGNPNCGAAGSSSASGGGSSIPAPATAPATAPKEEAEVRAKLFKEARPKDGKLPVARVACSAPCGSIRAVVRAGKQVIARSFVKRAGRKQVVVAGLTKPGRGLLRRGRKLTARLDLWIAPADQRATHRHGQLLVGRG